MSVRKAKRIRKALFKKGIPVSKDTYQRITHGNGSHQIIASPERRVYKALKRKPIKEALAIIGKLQYSRQAPKPAAGKA